ncbi:TolC family protein [Terriglobus sp.]|uniref:TolC family protein n=1 Tax=Terriglobus sp. TaxID=1889013 RepID=UPI003B001AB6
MKFFRTAVLGAFASSCATTHGQQLPSAPPESVSTVASTTPLTLDEAVAIARANSPRLREAASATRQALAGVQTARAYSNPSVEVFEGRQYARPISTPGIPGLLQHYAAYQPIEIPKERNARKRAATLSGEASRFAEQSVSLSVVADTKHAFYDALRRREEIEHAQENLQLVEGLQRRVAVEVNVGEKGRLELTRATAERARAQFAVASAQLQYAQAIARLRAVIAASADTTLDPQGDMEQRTDLPPLPEMRGLVLRTHPALQQTQKDKEAAQANLERQRALRIPQPTAFAEFENQPDLRFWRAGVTIALPIFDRRRGPIAEASASIDRNAAVLAQRTLELTSALERAYEQYQLADQQANSLQSGPLHAAESAVQGAQAAYRFGERGIVEVLDAQRVLQSVRGDLLDAQYARQSARVDLEELGAVAPIGVTP